MGHNTPPLHGGITIFTYNTVTRLQITSGKMSESFPQCCKAGIFTRPSSVDQHGQTETSGGKNNNNSEEHAQSNYERGPGLSTESRGLKLSGTDQFERGMPA